MTTSKCFLAPDFSIFKGAFSSKSIFVGVCAGEQPQIKALKTHTRAESSALIFTGLSK